MSSSSGGGLVKEKNLIKSSKEKGKTKGKGKITSSSCKKSLKEEVSVSRSTRSRVDKESMVKLKNPFVKKGGDEEEISEGKKERKEELEMEVHESEEQEQEVEQPVRRNLKSSQGSKKEAGSSKAQVENKAKDQMKSFETSSVNPKSRDASSKTKEVEEEIEDEEVEPEVEIQGQGPESEARKGESEVEDLSEAEEAVEVEPKSSTPPPQILKEKVVEEEEEDELEVDQTGETAGEETQMPEKEKIKSPLKEVKVEQVQEQESDESDEDGSIMEEASQEVAPVSKTQEIDSDEYDSEVSEEDEETKSLELEKKHQPEVTVITKDDSILPSTTPAPNAGINKYRSSFLNKSIRKNYEEETKKMEVDSDSDEDEEEEEEGTQVLGKKNSSLEKNTLANSKAKIENSSTSTAVTATIKSKGMKRKSSEQGEEEDQPSSSGSSKAPRSDNFKKESSSAPQVARSNIPSIQPKKNALNDIKERIDAAKKTGGARAGGMGKSIIGNVASTSEKDKEADFGMKEPGMVPSTSTFRVIPTPHSPGSSIPVKNTRSSPFKTRSQINTEGVSASSPVRHVGGGVGGSPIRQASPVRPAFMRASESVGNMVEKWETQGKGSTLRNPPLSPNPIKDSHMASVSTTPIASPMGFPRNLNAFNKRINYGFQSLEGGLREEKELEVEKGKQVEAEKKQDVQEKGKEKEKEIEKEEISEEESDEEVALEIQKGGDEEEEEPQFNDAQAEMEVDEVEEVKSPQVEKEAQVIIKNRGDENLVSESDDQDDVETEEEADDEDEDDDEEMRLEEISSPKPEVVEKPKAAAASSKRVNSPPISPSKAQQKSTISKPVSKLPTSSHQSSSSDSNNPSSATSWFDKATKLVSNIVGGGVAKQPPLPIPQPPKIPGQSARSRFQPPGTGGFVPKSKIPGAGTNKDSQSRFGSTTQQSQSQASSSRLQQPGLNSSTATKPASLAKAEYNRKVQEMDLKRRAEEKERNRLELLKKKEATARGIQEADEKEKNKRFAEDSERRSNPQFASINGKSKLKPNLNKERDEDETATNNGKKRKVSPEPEPRFHLMQSQQSKSHQYGSVSKAHGIPGAAPPLSYKLNASTSGIPRSNTSSAGFNPATQPIMFDQNQKNGSQIASGGSKNLAQKSHSQIQGSSKHNGTFSSKNHFQPSKPQPQLQVQQHHEMLARQNQQVREEESEEEEQFVEGQGDVSLPDIASE